MTLHFIPPETVAVPEISYKSNVRVAPAETALIIVDMQNDFVRSDGALAVEAAPLTVPRIARLLARARQHHVHIAFTQDLHLPADLEWHVWPKHAQVNTAGWHIIDELRPRSGELICRKDRYAGFYGTDLDHYLTHVWHVKNAIVVGTVANICVLHTAASAGLRWLNLIVPANGISALNDFDQALTLRQVAWLYTGTVVKDVDDIQFE
jgi:nicotinamidase-related amidase